MTETVVVSAKNAGQMLSEDFDVSHHPPVLVIAKQANVQECVRCAAKMEFAKRIAINAKPVTQHLKGAVVVSFEQDAVTLPVIKQVAFPNVVIL